MTTVYPSSEDLSFSSKAQYRLRIRGYIDSSWSDRLGGLVITSEFGDTSKPVTTLEGGLADQAELIGILNSVYEMHLPLLSVTFVKTL